MAPTADLPSTLPDDDLMAIEFERHYDCLWGDPTMRPERLAWLAAWRRATAHAQLRHEHDLRQRSTAP